jgi:ABC-type multidrug transport system fused ATPase/permease subunit
MKRSSMPKLERIHLHTNALLWTPRIWATIPTETRALVKSATISIDAARPDTYAENRRGGDFETLLERLAFIGGLRRNGPLEYLEIHMTVQLNNFEQMPEFVELGRRHGCDRVTFHQMVDWDTFPPAEFAARAVHQPQHPRHGAFLAMLHHPSLKHPSVNLSNLTELAAQVPPEPGAEGAAGHMVRPPTERPVEATRWSLWPPLPGMRDLIQDLRDGRALFATAREHLGFLPLMAILAVLSSAFEGVGLTLVVPLVQSLRGPAGPAASYGYLGLLDRFVAGFAPAARTEAVLALIIGAVVAKSVFSYANMAVLGVVYGRVSHRLRTTVLERVLSLPLSKVEREKSGRLLNTLSNETWRATDAVNLVFVMITSLATATVFVSLLMLLSWKLTLIAIGCLSLVPPVVQLVTKHAKRLSRLANEANEALAQQTWSTLNGLRTIHAFGREAYEQERFATTSDRVRALFLKMALVVMTTGPITEIMIVGVLALLVLLASSGPTSLGTLVAFLALFYRLQPRLLALASAQSTLTSLHGSITAVSAILKRESAAVPRSSGVAQDFDGPVSFRQVTFRYPDTPIAAVENLSFELPTAGLVAIVGVSGAGKSTLLDLLLGFQTPQVGEIRIGDQLLTETIATAWRRHVGVVSQDPYVFDDTVRANILYGRPEASEADMIRVATAVAAHGFIEALPQGYNTRVGERAAQLSGGERQRLALARAFLRDPALLVLDEATNALDAATENVCRAALETFARDKLVVVVAHRYSTVASADLVIVLRDGRIVEQGPPATLLRTGGSFAQMFASGQTDLSESSAVGVRAR